MRTLEFDLHSDLEIWDAVAAILDERLERAANAQESLNAIANVVYVAAAGFKALAEGRQLDKAFDEDTFAALARQMFRCVVAGGEP